MLLRSSLLSSVVFQPFRAAAGEGTPPTEPVVENTESDESNVLPDSNELMASGAHADAQSGDDPPAEPETPAVTRDWRDREIARKHAQIQEGKRAAEELKRENDELRAIAARAARAPADGDPPAAPAARPSAEDDQRRIDEAADRKIAKENYDRACNDAFTKGVKEYGPKWNESLENLKLLGGLDMEAMNGVLATDDPTRVLFMLGANPDEYHRVMTLTPARRLNEMAKMAAVPVKQPKKISDAAAPVEAIAGRGVRGADGLDDEVDDQTWYARRKAQKLEAYKKKKELGLV